MNNLISNAIKFTEIGSVIIKAKLIYINNGNIIKFTVKDTGVGISDEILPNIC